MTPLQIPRVAMTRLEIPDYNIGLRGKLVRAENTKPGSSASFCTIAYGMSIKDEVTDTVFSNAANGYPDAKLQFDEETRIAIPWQAGRDAIIADLVNADGTPFGASPRGVIQSLLARYTKFCLMPVLGYEFEFWIFHDDDRGRPQGDTEAVGRVTNAYSLSRIAKLDDLIEEFLARMESIGIHIEAFHSELGPGLFEFTMAPQPALKAADNAVRAKLCMRELCAERGLAASFMAKPFGGESGAGGHIHSSLVSQGRNVFSSEPGVLSETARNFIAGLLELMPDVTSLFAPYINSYKRIDPEQYVSHVSNWALDSRAVACRVLLPSTSAARVEHRIAGADTSPYFSAIGVLASGLYGLEQKLDLDAITQDRPRPLPRTLSDAIERFSSSEIVRDLLGDMFVESVAAVQRSEVNAYETWLRTNITEWERVRHLEHH